VFCASSVYRTVSAFRPRFLRRPVEELVRAEAWRALRRRTEKELDGADSGRGFTARLRHYRGLALLRMGKAQEAIQDFRAASRLRLRSPELHADWIEACLTAGGPVELPEIHPDSASLLFGPGRLSKEQRAALVKRIHGDKPHLLILAGKYDEALQKLPKGQTWDWRALSLRALAKREKGDLESARIDLEQAIRQNPHNRNLRRQMDVLNK